jgi:hypothetical protein
MGHGVSEKRRQKDQEKLGRLERTIDRQGTIRLVLILCGTVPFFFFLDTRWGHAALLGYAITAFFFGLLLVPDYPPAWHELVLEDDDSNRGCSLGSRLWSSVARSEYS